MPVLAVDANGAMTVPPVVAVGLDAVAARVVVRLGRVRGRGVLDTTGGMPWDDWNNEPGKVRRDEVVQQLRLELLDVEGVTGIQSLAAVVTGRRLVVTVVLTASADGITGTVEAVLGYDLSTMPAVNVMRMLAFPGRC